MAERGEGGDDRNSFTSHLWPLSSSNPCQHWQGERGRVKRGGREREGGKGGGGGGGVGTILPKFHSKPSQSFSREKRGLMSCRF